MPKQQFEPVWGHPKICSIADLFSQPDAQCAAEKATINAKLQELDGRLRARRIQLSPEELKEVFTVWCEQVTDSLGRQYLQAARVLIERFIVKIELGYDQFCIRYRYPLDAGLAERNRVGEHWERNRLSEPCMTWTARVFNPFINWPHIWRKSLSRPDRRGRFP